MGGGDYPTRDGKFKGQKYECAICAKVIRRYEGVMQRGHLVCKETCWDKPGFKNKKQ